MVSDGKHFPIQMILTNRRKKQLRELQRHLKPPAHQKILFQESVKWLLKTRNEHVWTTTKSTAAIIGLLQTPDLPGEAHQLSAKTEDSVLTVTDDLFGGKTADFIDLSGKKFPSQISVSAISSATVSGSIKYYYFSSNPPADSLNAIVTDS